MLDPHEAYKSDVIEQQLMRIHLFAADPVAERHSMRALTHISSSRHDPLARFGDHHSLIADLAQALEPGSPQAVLAVFELVGSSDYRDAYGERASVGLVTRCAERFTGVIENAGQYYRARQDEFCALITGPIDAVIDILVAAEHALEAEEQALQVSGCFGAAISPEEAADPIELLVLADQRLRVRLGGRKPREVVSGHSSF
jgi:GGDEF domain-containing protein